MTKTILSTLGLLILAASARAEERNYTYAGVKLTAYSAACKHDRFGGSTNQSSIDSRLKPRSHTLDGTNFSDNVVVTAVPQYGGMASLYRCFYKVLPPSGTPASLREKMRKKIFFAGDHYGTGSNNKMKVDVSYSCGPTLNQRTYNGAKIQRLSCLRKGANVIAAIGDLLRKNFAPVRYTSLTPPARDVTIVSAVQAGR